MTIQEAINVVDLVCQQYKGTRKEHSTLVEALNIIQESIKKNNKSSKDNS